MAVQPGWFARQSQRVKEEVDVWPNWMKRAAGLEVVDMWFMVYQMLKESDKTWTWYTCNCTTSKHPVVQLKEWLDAKNGYQYRLLFYDKLPDEVSERVKNIDV